MALEAVAARTARMEDGEEERLEVDNEEERLEGGDDTEREGEEGPSVDGDAITFVFIVAE